MEKRTVLAIVLSVMVFAGFYLIQTMLYPPEPVQGTENTSPPSESPVQPVTAAPVPVETVTAPETQEADTGPIGELSDEALTDLVIPGEEERITIETDLFVAVLTNAGGDMVSYDLKQHKNKGEYVQMILPGDTEAHAFTVAFGGREAQPVKSLFRVNRPSPLIVEFLQDFAVGGGKVTLTKRYEFKADEYMFALTIVLNGGPVNVNNAAYTLEFGPQIGPPFEKLDNRYEYRHYVTFTTKRSVVKVDKLVDSRFTWAGIAGKYFTVMVVPDNTLYELMFSDKAENGIPSASRLYMTRPATGGGLTSDVYHFYLGPKNQENLGRYDTGNNGFKLKELQFIKAANTSGFLSPLENLLKLGLQMFYKFIPNYGVAIILLTMLVKLLLFPLTKKSSEAAVKMQAIAPKIKELQAKYKDTPAKLNAEMAALYKKEGHNPMSGCLPMLIQLPILFAMYNLFNTHFDLRGAMFIPGWIPDLSLPEAIMTFSGRLPLLGWNSLRLLPFIYLGSQLMYGFVTRTPEQQGNPSMAMMMYAMPVMFFFILYDVPSGLLVFWIFSNVFTLVQQLILNKYLAKKKAAALAVSGEQESPKPVIAPKKKKKR